VLVSAPAGFGKTTLLSEWVGQCDCQTAWISLGADENDPVRFLTYFTAAFQRIDPTLGEDIFSILSSPQPPPLETILTSLLNQLAALDETTILVLDDYHLIENPAIHAGLTFFVENAPPQAYLAILSRADPPLPLARLRARGQMTEIRAIDLRFTIPEIPPFLKQVMQLEMTPDQIQALEAKTEGWAAGLQMAALSLRAKPDVDAFIADFSGSHRYILDYLTEEVIQGQPEDTRQFILQTSILNRMSAPLCEAVTGQERGQENLEALEEANLFLVPLDDERVWYRYHHLFADVMANRLQRVYPDRMPDLHHRAAKWFEENGFIGEALDHALAAKALDYAAALVEGQAMAQLKAGSIATLSGWFDKLPRDTILERPMLSVQNAWLLLLTGQQDEIETYLEAAEKNLPAAPDPNTLSGNISAIRAYAASRLRDFDTAIGAANKALAILPIDDLSTRAVVTFVLGWVHYSLGDSQRALAAMQQAGQDGEKGGNIHLAVQAWSAQAYFLKRQGQYQESEKVYTNVLQLDGGQRGKPLPFTAIIYSGLADLYLLQSDLVKARRFSLTGLELAKKWLNVDSQVGCLLTLAQVEALEGHLRKAGAALEAAKQLAASHQLTQGNQDFIAIVEAKIFETPQDAAQSSLPEPLTERELEVLQLLAAGKSNRAISEELVIALGTTKTHISRIMGKLNAENRTQAGIIGRELGLVK